MYYNYYSRIQYVQPPQVHNMVPRMSVIPQNIHQMRESIQMGVYQQREMQASTILEVGSRNIKRNTQYKQRNLQLEELYLQYEDGCVYRGQGKAPSTRQGLGVLFSPMFNEIYSGEWMNNQYDGFGILINQTPKQLKKKVDARNLNSIEDGWKDYKGYFRQNKMHGEGILTLLNGEKYEGHFENGMIHGMGKFFGEREKLVYGNYYEGILQ